MADPIQPPTPADRLALALCRVIDPATGTCATGEVCRRCRRNAAAVVRELAKQAGSAKRWHVVRLRALAAELEETVQTVQEEI
jgi:hypothetical protein